jgi:hypothetical protein
MLVTAAQVAALRAYLVLDLFEADRLNRQLVQTDDLDGYGELVYAAFVTAARRKFSPTWTVADIIRFVANARAQRGGDADDINPRAAENLIRRALDDHVADEVDQETKARTQILLLAALVEDQQLSDADLDEFLGTVHMLTSQWWPN